jgi:protein required for attachment to host cells
MRKARIWVLTVDGEGARICSTADGRTKFIPTPAYPALMSRDAPAFRGCKAYEAWYRADRPCLLVSGAVGHFAAHLAQVLREGAREQAYDGLIVIASPEIARSLERALAPETCALLVGEVVRDLPRTTVPEFSQELRN